MKFILLIFNWGKVFVRKNLPLCIYQPGQTTGQEVTIKDNSSSESINFLSGVEKLPKLPNFQAEISPSASNAEITGNIMTPKILEAPIKNSNKELGKHTRSFRVKLNFSI